MTKHYLNFEIKKHPLNFLATSVVFEFEVGNNASSTSFLPFVLTNGITTLVCLFLNN